VSAHVASGIEARSEVFVLSSELAERREGKNREGRLEKNRVSDFIERIPGRVTFAFDLLPAELLSRCIGMTKIILISCSNKKLSHRARARDLYVSPLFKLQLAFAQSLKPKAIFILSAKYGLVDLGRMLEPYDQTLNTMSAREVQHWAKKVRRQMDGKIDFERDEVVFLAGEKYRKYLLPHFRNISVPLKGLGIGKQLSSLKRKTNHA
jgi:hypothetical protein